MAPERIICLCPSLTEALFDLGAGERVVGITDWCVHPQEKLKGLPRVGGTKTPDLEKIYSLKPDLVVVNEEENRLEDAEEIQSHGIAVLNIFPKTVQEAADGMRALATQIGQAAEGEKLANEIEAQIQNLKKLKTEQKPLRFAALIWRRPYMSVNHDTFVSDLLTLACGENVFGGQESRYPKISAEQLFCAKPDAIFLLSEPYGFTAPHAAEVSSDSGLPPEKIHLADGELLTWYGSRTPKGLRYASELLAKARRFV